MAQSPFGVNANDSDSNELDRSLAAGLDWIRLSSHGWTDTEWFPGQYNWAGADQAVTLARAHGMGVLYHVALQTPPWACDRCVNSGCRDCDWAKDLPAAYADPRTSRIYRFAHDAVVHLNGLYPDYPVRYFGGYNEVDGNASKVSDPASFLATYVSAVMQPIYLGVHDACTAIGLQGCQVIGPGISTMDFESGGGSAHTALFNAGAYKWVDANEYHPYQGWHQCQTNMLVDEFDHEHTWLTDHGLSLDTWFTETGQSLCSTSCDGPTQQLAFADALVPAIFSRPWITRAFIYELTDEPGGCGAGDNGWGIYDENKQPRPVRDHLRQLIDQRRCP